MRLATPIDVRNRRKTLPVGTGPDAAIEDALNGASQYLAGALNTEFDKIIRTHVYNVNLIEKPPTGQFTELFLEAGFVDVAQTISVKLNEVTEDLASSPDLTKDEDFVVDAKRGVILLDHRSLINADPGQVIVPQINTIAGLRGFGTRFLTKISYTAGFDVTAEVYQNVPLWLKEAAVIHSLITLDTQSPVVKPEFADKLRVKNKALWNSIFTIIDKHTRFFGETIKPLYSE